MKISVIGGGIIGLSTAYYLNKSGHDVTVFEEGTVQSGCSWGNAGMIVPSHMIPLAAPGMIARGIRWMFDAKSPFYVRPRLDKKLMRWGYLFYKHATAGHVGRSVPVLKELSLFSKSLYQDMAGSVPFDFGFRERGLLMLYKTKETEHEEAETARIANRQGVEARVLSGREVQDLEPDVELNVRGGVYFPGDAHLTPALLMQGLADYLVQRGVTIKFNTPVAGINAANGVIVSLQAGKETHAADEVVLAAGAWSAALGTQLGMALPMQGGKGYSFTLPNAAQNTRIPSILLEARVAVTPMGRDLRVGGTLEIAGLHKTVNMNRVRGIVDAIPRYYKDMTVAMPETQNVWHGFRPCSPDGLPYIGRTTKYRNLIIATGHAMMGMSLAPATGKLVAEIIDGEQNTLSLTPFMPERFGF